MLLKHWNFQHPQTASAAWPAKCWLSCRPRDTLACGYRLYAMQDIRVVLKEHVRGVTPGLSEGAPILIADDSEDREAPADEKLR